MLWQQYVNAVNGLSKSAAEMRAAGKSAEEIARALHAERRALGVQYKNLTPDDLLQQIHERNLGKYGDKLGPTIEYQSQFGGHCRLVDTGIDLKFTSGPMVKRFCGWWTATVKQLLSLSVSPTDTYGERP